MEDLSKLHLADLHAKAAEAGVNGYRMLSRDELIAEIEAGGKRKRSRWPRRKAPKVDADSETDELKVLGEGEGEGKDEGDSKADAPAEPRPARRRGRRGGRGRGGQGREKLASGEQGDAPEDEETEEITGVLEITRQRHGFLSVEGSDDDVYVSASQVRRCEMKEGDEVTGPVRAPRRGERHRALVRVNLVNGEPPVEAPEKKKSGGGAASARSAEAAESAAPQVVEFTLVSVEGEECVVEIEGSEHTLEPGDRLSVAIGAEGEPQVSKSRES
jgi:transcription termination factor Rho